MIDGKLSANVQADVPTRGYPAELLRDRSGAIWVGSPDVGLTHLHQQRRDVFARQDGLSSNTINRVFEDREGNVWVATTAGLDRFRELAAPTIAVDQGLATARVVSVLAARDGAIWISTTGG